MRVPPQLRPLDTGEFRLPQLRPLDTGEFRLPPLTHREVPPLNPRAVQLKPLDTDDFRLPPLEGPNDIQDEDSYDDDDTSPMGDSILGLRR